MNYNYNYNENNTQSNQSNQVTQSSQDSRVSRNFEELICERNTNFNENNFVNVFNEVFEKIKEKIFISGESEDMDLTEDEILVYNNKYNTSNSKILISKLKSDISELFLKKTEFEILIQERRRMFDDFCKNISMSIQSIIDINKNVLDEEDIALNKLLTKRIDWYFKELEIENLINEEYKIKSEFHFLRNAIKEISGLNPTICSICMENQVSWFIDPCGHTLCSSCKITTDGKQNCHYCRSSKNKLNRLYL